MTSGPTGQAPSAARREEPTIEAAIADLLLADTARLGAARRRLMTHPPEDVTRGLIAALDRQIGWKEFGRLATGLALCGIADGLTALEKLALEQRRHPLQVVRALERARTPECEALLLKFLASGSLGVRRSAAMALARGGSGAVIRPICVAAVARRPQADRRMLAALRIIGDPPKLVRRALEAPGATTEDHMAAIDALSAVPEIGRRLNAQRVLDRLATERGALGQAAAKAAQAYRDRATLVRPAERLGDTTLVRPLGGPPPARSDLLVRPSEAPAPAEHKETGIRSLWERLKDALQGD